jgi:ABC-type sugar transport system substrate-binding protein
VFILLGIDSIFSHRRTGGFKAGLTKNCPNVQVVGEQSGEWLRTKGSEVAAIALQKTPVPGFPELDNDKPTVPEKIISGK